MTRKRNCYQCGDDGRTLDEIREARNEEIRAWGRKVLADADAALKGETALVVEESDWDQVETQTIPEEVNEPVAAREEEAPEPDALAATEPQPGDEDSETQPEENESTVTPVKDETESDEKPAPKRASSRKGAPSKD